MQSSAFESVVSDCEITKVVLFKTGLAYYEREATVPAGESCINLTFNEDEIYQVVGTLMVDDPEGGVKSVTFGKTKGFGQRQLIGQQNKGFENLLQELRGARVKITFENKESCEGLCLGTERKWTPVGDGQNAQNLESSWLTVFDTYSNTLKHFEMRWIVNIDVLDKGVAQELEDALKNDITYRTEESHVKTNNVSIHLEGKEQRKVKISCVHTVGPWYIEYRLTTNPVRLDTWVVLQNPRHSFHNAALWAVSESLNASIGPDPNALAEHCLKSAQPVTVIKNSPALIPLSNFHVDAKIVIVHDKKLPKPSLAVLLKNKSKLPTEKGNVTIFQNGLYLGSSVINECRPGDDQFVHFTTSDSFKLETVTWHKKTYPNRLRLKDRTLQVQRNKKVFTTYSLKGLALDKPMDFYVLHPLPWTSSMSHNDNLIVVKDNVAIFKVVLEPTKKPSDSQVLRVEEQTVDHSQFPLKDLTRATANKWLSHKLINQQVFDTLGEIIAFNERMEVHAKLMDQKIAEMDDTLEDGKRIIGNISLVSEQLKDDSELRNKWMNQLLAYEEKYQEGRAEMRDMITKASEFEKLADELLSNLSLEIDLGEQPEDAQADAIVSGPIAFSFGGAQQQPSVFTKHKNYAQSLSDNFSTAVQNKSSFGSAPPQTGSFSFGSSTAPSQPQSSNPFSSSTTQVNPFGSSTASSNTFGGSAQPAAFGTGTGGFGRPAFGNTTTPQPSTSGSFSFGGSTTPATGSTPSFGSTTSSFGSAPSFGNSTPAFNASTTNTGGFGSTLPSATPAALFGSPATVASGSQPGSSSFSFNTSAPQSHPVFGGSSASNTAQPASTFTFGGSTAPNTSQPTSAFTFGSTTAAPTNPNPFGSAPPNPPSFSFGTTTAQPTSATPAVNAFGSAPSPSTDYRPTAVNENNQTVALQNIAAMPKYEHVSPEEIRAQNYSGQTGTQAKK